MKSNQFSENEPQNRRIRISGGDPFVRQTSINSSRSKIKEDSARQNERKERLLRLDDNRLREIRRRSTLLSIIFAALAVLMYAGLRATSPAIVVTLEGGEGIVYLDNEPVGNTGEIIKHLKLGQHVVRVKPSGTRQGVKPDSITVNLKYSLNPQFLTFRVQSLPLKLNSNEKK